MNYYLKTVLMLLALLPMSTKAQAQTPVNYFGAMPNLRVSGSNLVDEDNHAVVLHGVMETPNAYFTGGRWEGVNGQHWIVDYSDRWVEPCLQYFKHVFSAVANPAKGTYCNLFRLHLDPAWLKDNSITASGFTIKYEQDFNEKNELLYNDDGTPKMANHTYDPHGNYVNGEADIVHFSETKLRKYLESLYIPIIQEAIGHGLYVIVRPPGVFPHEIVVGDYYNDYLLKVWDIVSSNEYIKQHSGQISLELGNEPVHIWEKGTTNFSQNYYAYDWNRTVLYDFFQPIVNKIRSNGFNGIIWAVGTGYQAEYRSYKYKMLNDSKNNIAFAAHFYPGWYGSTANDQNRAQTDAQVLNTFKTQLPVQANYPIVITEVDWSPLGQGGGHYNEHGDWVVGNFGTYATGSTTTKSQFGNQFKYVMDQCGNVSWTIEGSGLYVDMDRYLQDGTVQPAFIDQMKANGYADAYEACSGAGFVWFKEYASGDKVPHGIPNVLPEEPITPTYKTDATIVGNAKFESKTGRYSFSTTYSAAFVFNKWKGTRLDECAELIINQGDGTTGYRLDVQIINSQGQDVVTGTYVIGNEASGTRSSDYIGVKAYKLYEIFANYLEQDPDCTIGSIRLNTAIPADDNTGLYWFTLDKMELVKGKMSVEKPVTGTDLADIPMYNYTSQKNHVLNDNGENGSHINGWGGNSTRTLVEKDGNHYYELYNPVVTDFWGCQALFECNCLLDTEYTLSLKIKGTSNGMVRVALHDGNQGCGDFGNVNFTTEWKTVTVKGTVINNNANRIYINYGDYAGTISIDDIEIYTGVDKRTLQENIMHLGADLSAGTEVYGVNGNVYYLDYADLTSYKKMVVMGTGGTLRFLFNRLSDNGSLTEKTQSFAEGKIEIDLSNIDSNPFVHLHSIKVNWGNTATVTSIRLYNDDNTTESVADYIITGAGYLGTSVQDALKDESATVIDVTGITNESPWHVKSANPNCLIVYKEDKQVDFSFDNVDRNLVKYSNGSYSSFRTDLVDGYDFRAPFAFNTVGGASYKRELASGTKWGTIALPFTLDVNAENAPYIYVLNSVEDGKMNFQKVTEATVPAGSVILYYNNNGGETALTGKDIAQTADGFNIQPIPGVNGWFTAQSFTNQVIDDVTKDPVLKDYEVYGISKNEMVHATKKLTLKPFRAFYLCKKSESNVKASFGIQLNDEEEADVETGITNVTAGVQATETMRYDATGCRIQIPGKGVSIIRMSDGSVKKVLR